MSAALTQHADKQSSQPGDSGVLLQAYFQNSEGKTNQPTNKRKQDPNPKQPPRLKTACCGRATCYKQHWYGPQVLTPSSRHKADCWDKFKFMVQPICRLVANKGRGGVLSSDSRGTNLKASHQGQLREHTATAGLSPPPQAPSHPELSLEQQ